jgi:radical SAM protein (TIGR01212 family)
VDGHILKSRLNLLGPWLRERFQGPVVKIGLDAGLGCPNRDGTLSRDGCRYCPPGGAGKSPQDKSVTTQLENGLKRIQARAAARKRPLPSVLAYFQAHSNTYGDPGHLAALYQEALSVPGVSGIIVSTRPDCLDRPRWQVLEKISAQAPLWLELGLQSAHDKTLEALNRRHDVACFDRAVGQARQRGIAVVAHVILGLPGETVAHTNATAAHLAELGLWGVKMHNLMVLEHTGLASDYHSGNLPLWTLSQWAEAAGQFLIRLPAQTVIHRLAADPGPDRLIAPEWAAQKDLALTRLAEYLERMDLRQGDLAS